MSHLDALVIGMQVDIQKSQLLKRAMKLFNRFDRMLDEIGGAITNAGAKLDKVKVSAQNGNYFVHDDSDVKQLLLQIHWENIAYDISESFYSIRDISLLPAKMRDELIFERDKQNEERIDLFKKEHIRDLDKRNDLPQISGKWRKEPYPQRVYEKLTNYVPASLTAKHSGLISVCTDQNPDNEHSDERRQLDTCLEGYLGQPYNYNDGELTEEWMSAFQDVAPADDQSKGKDSTGKTDKKKGTKKAKAAAISTNAKVDKELDQPIKSNQSKSNGPSTDDVIRIQLENLLEVMKIQVQDRVCTENKILTAVEPLDIGVVLKEVPVWGVDSYTRRMMEIVIEDNSSMYKSMLLLPEEDSGASNGNSSSSTSTQNASTIADNLTRGERVAKEAVVYFIESIVMPAINHLSAADAHDLRLAMTSILDHCANPVRKIRPYPNFVHCFASAVALGIEQYGLERFRIHPKGTGVVVCDPLDSNPRNINTTDKMGIPPHVVICPYLGELYLPFRWCEKLEVVEQAQKKYNLKPTLPDFYNILLERPRHDTKGYGLLYVDASQRANMGSSCSHSCNANCTSNVVSRNGKLAIVLTTNRWIYPGEELSMDYYSVTNSEVEWRASICLCGSKQCRGTFLHYASQSDLQQVLTQNCGILWRYATLLRACSYVPMSVDDKRFLCEHGMGEAVFGLKDKSSSISKHNDRDHLTTEPMEVAVNIKNDVEYTECDDSIPELTPASPSIGYNYDGIPDWVLKYASDNLRFIEYERKALPMALMRTNNSSKQGLFTAADGNIVNGKQSEPVYPYSFTEADVEARSVMEQRIQSFVSCYSMIMQVISGQSKGMESSSLLTVAPSSHSHASPSTELFPLKALFVTDAIARVWDILSTIPRLLQKYIVKFYEQRLLGKSSPVASTFVSSQPINGAEQGHSNAVGGTDSAPLNGKSKRSPVKKSGPGGSGAFIQPPVVPLFPDVNIQEALRHTRDVISDLKKLLHLSSASKVISSPGSADLNLPSASEFPQGFCSMRKLVLQVRALIETIVPYSTTEARLLLLCDMLVLWANTSHYSMVRAYTPVQSEPIRVVARELGTNIPRNKIHVPLKETTRADRANHRSLEVVASDMEAEELAKAIENSLESAHIPPIAQSAIMDPNELVYEGCRTYDKYFTFWQLMQWFNAGTDDKVTESDLFGCVQLPLPGACFGPTLGSKLHTGQGKEKSDTSSHYNVKSTQRKMLLELINNERLQINPWPTALKECFNGLYGHTSDLPSSFSGAQKSGMTDGTALSVDWYQHAIMGSPLLDISLGQMDALFRVRQDFAASALLSSAQSDTPTKGGIFAQLEAHHRQTSVNSHINSQFDSVLPPEMPAEWIQCDSCKKWRRIAWYVDHTGVQNMPTWTCAENTWDPEKTNCDAEADWFDADHENTLSVAANGQCDEVKESSMNIDDYKVGSYYDVWCDRNLLYYEAKLMEIKQLTSTVDEAGSVVPGEVKLKFNFKGWGPRFAEWIEMGSDRIQPHNLFTDSYTGPGNAMAITKHQIAFQRNSGTLQSSMLTGLSNADSTPKKKVGKSKASSPNNGVKPNKKLKTK